MEDEDRHKNCKENSSENRPLRNALKKQYSLPLLQKENEKLSEEIIALKAAYDEKEILLTETFRKVELLEEENHEMKNILHEAAKQEKVETIDASICVTIGTNDASHSISEIDNTSIDMKDAGNFVEVATKDKSTSTSIVMEDASTFVRIATKNRATQVEVETNCESMPSSGNTESGSQGDFEATSLQFDEKLLPYGAKSEVLTFETNLKNSNVSSDLEQYFQKIGGATISKVVNNILNSILTKGVLKLFVWDATSADSFQNLKNILGCIYSVVCSKENTQQIVNNIIKNAIKNARAQ